MSFTGLPDDMLDEFVKMSTIANNQLRSLKNKYETNPERIDIMYVIYVWCETEWMTKIGRSTLDGFLRRMKEHNNDFGKIHNINLVSIRKIEHWTDETKFHKHMKQYENGSFVCDVIVNGKKHREVYVKCEEVLEIFNKFIDDLVPV